jgi:hypothetical protein
MADVHQFNDLLTEWRADRPRKQQAVFLEHAADLVFDVTADTDEAGSGDQDRADFLALLALHGNLTMPTDPDEFSEALVGITIQFDDPRKQAQPVEIELSFGHKDELARDGGCSFNAVDPV